MVHGFMNISFVCVKCLEAVEIVLSLALENQMVTCQPCGTVYSVIAKISVIPS